jgi:hypothetical protein
MVEYGESLLWICDLGEYGEEKVREEWTHEM